MDAEGCDTPEAGVSDRQSGRSGPRHLPANSDRVPPCATPRGKNMPLSLRLMVFSSVAGGALVMLAAGASFMVLFHPLAAEARATAAMTHGAALQWLLPVAALLGLVFLILGIGIHQQREWARKSMFPALIAVWLQTGAYYLWATRTEPHPVDLMPVPTLAVGPAFLSLLLLALPSSILLWFLCRPNIREWFRKSNNEYNPPRDASVRE